MRSGTSAVVAAALFAACSSSPASVDAGCVGEGSSCRQASACCPGLSCLEQLCLGGGAAAQSSSGSGTTQLGSAAGSSGSSSTSSSGTGGAATSSISNTSSSAAITSGSTPGGSSRTTSGSGSGGTTGGTRKGPLCSPCASDADCVAGDYCIYSPDSQATYVCAPSCPDCSTNAGCSNGTACDCNGDDIDNVNTYDVCFPPSNSCDGWDGGG